MFLVSEKQACLWRRRLSPLREKKEVLAFPNVAVDNVFDTEFTVFLSLSLV